MRHMSATGNEIRPFLLYVRTSKKHSDSSRLSRLVVNLAAFVRGGSDHEMQPKNLHAASLSYVENAYVIVLEPRMLRVELCLRIIRKVK